jgi:hypothetical protein
MTAPVTSGLFAGMAQAEVSTRTPNPKEGKAWYLISGIKLEKSRKDVQYISIKYLCVTSLTDKEGRKAGTENYEGEVFGARVSTAMFQGDYFLKELKRFILVALDKAPGQEQEVVDEALAAMKADAAYTFAPDMAEEDAAWDYMCKLVCGIGYDSGCFDGTVVIEMDTKRTVKVSDTEFTKNAEGVLVPKTSDYTNTYPVRRVAFGEVGEAINDGDRIKKVFGSVERFQQLYAAEQA